jgi:hypothetical protein
MKLLLRKNVNLRRSNLIYYLHSKSTYLESKKINIYFFDHIQLVIFS